MLAVFILVGIFATIILIPCIGISILGTHLMERIGRYPSKTPAFQVNTFIKIFILEIISFGLLIAVFHVLSSFSKGG